MNVSSISPISFHHTVSIPKSNDFHRHMHNGYELFYFIKGDAEYIIEGAVYELHPGDMLFIPPRKFHYLSPLSEATYERFVIHFSMDNVPDILREFVESSKIIYRIEGGSLVERFFDMWKDAEALLSQDEMSEYMQGALSHALLFLMHLPSHSNIAPIRKDSTLESILQYIDSHPGENLTAETLSKKFYMSSSWIVHTFKKNLGLSLMQYIQKKRILYAEALIQSGITPTEASKLCNYESYPTFYRQYKKFIGISPVETQKKRGK